MASTYSTNLALTLMATGENSGTWGDLANTNLGTLVEQAISGIVTQAIADGADTTITIPNGTTGVARNMFIEMTGSLSADRNLIVPANKKLYFIYNNTTGGHAVTVKVTGQTGVSVPNGSKVILAINSGGTDIVSAVSYLSNGAAISGTTGTFTAGISSTRINSRIGTEVSSATSTPTGDTVDQWNVTALATATDTIAAPTGTPVDGQKLIIRITSDASIRTLAWNSIYRAGSDLALPTATVASKTQYFGFLYNALASKWDFLAYIGNF